MSPGRLFVAVDPSEAAVADLARVVDGLHVARARARVTARSLWHVTLAFLGDVEESRVGDAVAALRGAAGHARRFRLRIAGGGTFPRSRDHVMWAGLDGDVEGLGLLARLVRMELRRARLWYDERPYRPHLTLARPGERVPADHVERDVVTLAGYRGPSWSVTEVHLMRSFGGPHPRYERVTTVSLPA